MPFAYVSEKLKESKKKAIRKKKETEGRDIYFNHNSHHS